MLNLFKTSIVEPNKIINYRQDSLLKVWAYMLFFALLSMAGPLIDAMVNEGLSLKVRNEIREIGIPSTENCNIIDALLVCDNQTAETLITYDRVNMVIDSHDTIQFDKLTPREYNFVIHKDTVSFVFYGQVLWDKSIQEFDESIHQLDFNYTEETQNDYYRALFQAIDHEIYLLRSMRLIVVGISTTLYSLFLFNIIILINTFLSRARLQQVPFKEMYVMMSYAATVLYIVIIFETMLRFNIFVFLVLLLVAFRQMSKLTLEIQNQMIKK